MANRKVFISYSRKDYVDVRDNVIPNSPIVEIKKRLDSEEIESWIDLDGEYAGNSFVSEIISEIKQCDVLLFISSRESNKSTYTPNELSVAKKNKKLIIPVKIDDADFSDEISFYVPEHIDVVEYFKNPDAGLDKMVKNIKAEYKRLDDLECREQQAEIARQRQESLRKELRQIKAGIRGRIEKDAVAVPRLIEIERQLNGVCDDEAQCPICGVKKENKDYCENCGWFYKTITERLIAPKAQEYSERLEYSKIVWGQKDKFDEIESDLKLAKAELRKYKQQIETLQYELKEAKEQVKSTEDRNSRLMQENEELSETCRTQQKENDRKQKRLAKSKTYGSLLPSTLQVPGYKPKL